MTPKTIKMLGGGGGTSRKFGWGCAARFLKPLPYFRPKSVIFPTLFQTWSNLIPYLRPEALESGAWLERVTNCYGTYTVVGVNIKREMVLSPSVEEVANSSKKYTQFKTRVHKPYPISDRNGRNWYPISDRNGWKKNIPFDAAHTYIAYIRDFSQGLAVYASETNKCHQLRRLTFKDRQIWPVTC